MTATRLIQRGVGAHEAGRAAEAEALFREALEADPNEPTALQLLGLLRFEAGDPREARLLLERAARLLPETALPHTALAAISAAEGNLEAAAAAYRAAAALTPEDPTLLLSLANIERALGRLESALEAALRACAAAPTRADAELAVGAALFGLHRTAEAAGAYQRAAALDPTLVAAHVGRGLALLADQAPDEAAACAEAALAQDPAAPLAWCVLGMARHARGAFWPAAEALERAAALAPDLAVAHRCLGLVYYDLERLAFAEPHLLKALELAPEDAGVHASLSSLYCREDRLEAGRRHALLALKIDPGERTAHENLARLLAREGRLEEARRHRDAAYGESAFRAIGLGPGRPTVLILAAVDTGNTPERFLLPLDRYGRVYWFMEFARSGDPSALPPFDLVFNAIGDQDETLPTAAAVEAFLKLNRKPVLNRPEAVARTARDGAPALLGGIETLMIPNVVRLSAARLAGEGLLAAAAAEGLAPPFLIRPLGSHGGLGLTLIANAEEALRSSLTADRDHYATAFHDFRDRDGLYRKYRAIFIDREPYPYHLAIGEGWLLHYESSGTRDHEARLSEERRFLDDPEGALGVRAMATLREIAQRLDLDFAGADFALLDDGRVLLFEANATMLVHPEAEGPTAHKNPYVERILAAFRALVARRLEEAVSWRPR